jgi:hypothetical protein
MNASVALAGKTKRENVAQLYLVWSADWVEAPPVAPPPKRRARPKAPPASGMRMPRHRERPQELDLQFVELVNAWISAEVDRCRALFSMQRPMSPAAKQVATLNVDRMSAVVRRARFALEAAVKEEAGERA